MSGFSIDKLKESLLSSIASLLENRNEYLNNPAADFTRHKLISFEKTILFSLIAEGGTLSTEILNYFPAEKMPTASALIQQKHKIKTKAYEDLFKNFTDKLPVLNTIKGLRAIAVDGSHLNAPYNPRDEFSYTNSIKDRKGHNELVLNAAYDPINNVFLDAVIQGYHSMNEPGAYCTMVDRYSGDPYSALFIMDRGYATYNTIAHSIHNKQYFLIRAKQSFVYGLSKDNSVLHGTEEFDERITIHIGRKNTQNCRMYENYHCLRKSTRTYDYLRDDDDIDTLSFRVLRIKINDSLTEYIVTNLPEEIFPFQDIAELYHLRWNEENSFRELKYAVGLVHFHAKNHEFQLQEIFAKLTMYNFSVAVMSSIEPCSSKKDTKHEYVLDKTYAFKACMKYLKGLLENAAALIALKKVPVRPGRSFPRTLRRQSADTFNYR